MRMEVQVLKDALQRMQSEMVDMRQGIGFAVPMVKPVVEETADLGHFDKEIAMENVENVPDIKEVVVPAEAQAALVEAKRQAYRDASISAAKQAEREDVCLDEARKIWRQAGKHAARQVEAGAAMRQNQRGMCHATEAGAVVRRSPSSTSPK